MFVFFVIAERKTITPAPWIFVTSSPVFPLTATELIPAGTFTYIPFSGDQSGCWILLTVAVVESSYENPSPKSVQTFTEGSLVVVSPSSSIFNVAFPVTVAEFSVAVALTTIWYSPTANVLTSDKGINIPWAFVPSIFTLFPFTVVVIEAASTSVPHAKWILALSNIPWHVNPAIVASPSVTV